MMDHAAIISITAGLLYVWQVYKEQRSDKESNQQLISYSSHLENLTNIKVISISCDQYFFSELSKVYYSIKSSHQKTFSKVDKFVAVHFIIILALF